jgi:peptidoglycan-associated lipoprotein
MRTRSRYPRLFGTCLLALMVFVFAAGCKPKPHPTPPPPPPPPVQEGAPAKPTARLSVNPTSIERGQSASLEWSTTGATSVNIEGVGSVAASGSQSVRPTQSTTYRLTANGPGGSETATARVTVTNPPPEPPRVQQQRGPTEEEIFAQEVKTIYFDYDKYEIREDQKAALQGNANFLRTHPSMKVVVEGHCDERGSEEYNLGLGDRRANAVKEALGAMGVTGDRVRTLSYGKERPVCTDANEDCWQKNRRGQFVLDR